MVTKKIAYFALMCLLSVYPLIFYYGIAPTDTSRRVLFIADLTSPGGFGDQVWRGIQDADLATDPSRRLEIIKIDQYPSLQFPEPWRSRSLRRQILRELGDGPVLAMITASTSANTEPVLEVARAFKVPVLLTVATNDSLLRRLPNETGSAGLSRLRALRLLPNDSRQAVSLATWIINNRRNYLLYHSAGLQKQAQLRFKTVPTTSDKQLAIRKVRPITITKSNERPVMIAYDNSLYGRYLYEQVNQNLSKSNVKTLSWRFGSFSRMVDLIRDFKSAQAREIIFLGYYPEARELLDSARALNFREPILLSDGAFSSGLLEIDTGSPNIYLSQSVNPQSKLPKSLQGFSVYGHDAYMIVNLAHQKTDGNSSSQEDFLSRVKQVIRIVQQGGERKEKPKGNYEFDDSGENTAAKFYIVPLHKIKQG